MASYNMSIMNNILAMNAQNNYKLRTKSNVKSTEKLSSGYKINRAADDAAGLAISEKMRSLIRALDQGTKNAQDGVSWVQTGDGAIEEVGELLQRMNELTIKSLNGTNSDSDRAAMELEFNELQTEIDRITKTTEFNTKEIFLEHDIPYYQIEGNRVWKHDQTMNIVQPDNDLTFSFRRTEGDTPQTVTLTIPDGKYTIQEIADEIDDQLSFSGLNNSGIYMEFTGKGTFNLNLEGGASIDSVTGSLSALLFDTFKGGSMGALIGTTQFPTETASIRVTDENNHMEFMVEEVGGPTQKVSVTLTKGSYNRNQLIDAINAQVSSYGIEAVKYGQSIKLSGKDNIITGFKGNMFKIETTDPQWSSAFYDNVMYGAVNKTAGSLLGSPVLAKGSERDPEHSTYKISASNNTLSFTANGATTPTNIIIADGEYTAEQMVAELNRQFSSNSLGLEAKLYEDTYFKGVRIDSTVKGLESKVGLDKNSSAYNTIFERRSYYQFSISDIGFSDRNNGNSFAYTYGDKSFTTASGTLPHTITAGLNDTFKLTMDGNSKEITLTEKDYGSLQDIVDEINNQLKNGSLDDKVKAEVDGSRIRLTGKKGSLITRLTVDSVPGNEGYKDLFQTVTTSSLTVSNSNSTTPDKITLNTPVSNPVTIPSSKRTLGIQIDGLTRTVTLPTGTDISHEQILTAINSVINSDVVNPTSISYNSNLSGTNSMAYTYTNSGSTIERSTYYNRGTSGASQGQASDSNGTPASCQVQTPLASTTTISSSNNKINLSINGNNKTLTLSNGSYSPAALASELQSKINDAYGSDFGSAKVSLDSQNRLVITAVLDKDDSAHYGDDTSIQLGTSSSGSSFMYSIDAVKTPASFTVDYAMKTSGIVIDNASKNFTFVISEGGANKTKTITLDKGTYTQAGFIDMFNKKLSANGIAAKASVSGGKFKLETTNTGNGNYLSCSMGTNMDMFGAICQNFATQGKRTISTPLKDTIVIDDTNNIFKTNVSPQKNITLEKGTYNKNDFVKMLNKALDEQEGLMKVSLDGNKMVVTMEKYGLSYSNIGNYSLGSAQGAMYGFTTYGGATASFEDDKLVITRNNDQSSLSVSSTSGSIFQLGKETLSTPYSRSATTARAYVDGRNITEPVVVDKYSKDLTFRYCNGDSTLKSYKVTVPEGTYSSFSDLQTALQSALDTTVGPKELTAKVSATGVRIETYNPGSLFYFGSEGFSGGFYDRIIGKATEINIDLEPQGWNGNQSGTEAFAVGRKNIRDNITEIQKGINDTLSLDFSINGNTKTLEFKLNPGEYRGQALVNEIQTKLNQQLVANGFSENLIQAQIGGVSTGVVGSNDNNALVFKLSNKLPLPEIGEYIVDGISGNAAFSVFYQTDGEIKVSYIAGSKDMTGGTTIKEGENDLTFDLDGSPVTVNIPSGKYTADELVDTINADLEAQGVDALTQITENGNLKIYSTKFGDYSIDNVRGGAYEEVFCNTNSATTGEKDINIQFSNVKDDNLLIDKPKLSTNFLGINTITISKPKYAAKALDRIDTALGRVNGIRSYFGAMQNRIEHTIANNDNKSENLSAADSRIRDTDMTKESVEYSKSKILMQVSEAMLSQANQSPQGILSLLS